MKSLCFAVLLCCCSAFSGFGQGLVNFYNRVIGGTDPVSASIFGPEPGDPTIEKHGNPPFGFPIGGIPAGTQSYGGLPLAGTGFTAQLWGGPASQVGYDPVLGLVATTTFRTGVAAGFLAHQTGPNGDIWPVPGVLPGEFASFELRVWDNQGGTITSWAQVLVNDTVLRGSSGVFSPPYPLGGIVPEGAPPVPANLVGLESFNLFIPVPEPSVAWLACAGAVAMWAARWRRAPTRSGRD